MSYVVREECWERGQERAGFKLSTDDSEWFSLEVFRQQGRDRTRVRLEYPLADESTGERMCAGIAAGLHVAGFEPEMVWVVDEWKGPDSSILHTTQAGNDYTTEDE